MNIERYTNVNIECMKGNIFISGIIKLSENESKNLRAVLFKLKAYAIKKCSEEKKLYWSETTQTSFDYYYRHFFADFVDLCFGEKRIFINWVNEIIPDSNLKITYEII